MSRHRILSLLAAGVAFAVVAASVAMVGAASAQGRKAADDPFGDLDLESLRKSNGIRQSAPTTAAPDSQSSAPAAQTTGDVPSLNCTDPIGALTRTTAFDSARRIYVGRSKTGTLACYFREEGDSHRLDIGIAAQGAFVRLQTPEPRELTPSPPVQVFAGKEKTRRVGNNEFATGEFTALKSYNGDVEFFVPKPTTGDFTVIAKSDPAAFLAMVAGAKTQFVVVRSIADPKAANIVAVYGFDAAMIPVILSCARAQHLAATAPTATTAPAAPVADAAGPEAWTAYVNPRFGTTVDFPAGIFSQRDPAPENGDGQTFRSADGRAQLSVYGTHNIEGDTPQSYVDKYVDRQGVTFRRVTATFFAISGIRDGAIFYQRCNFPAAPGDIIDCMNVSYPTDQKSAWNPIVGRLGRSLRAGQGIEARQ